MSERRTVVPSGRVLPRFSGLVTFARAPRLEDVGAGHRPLDWVVYGAAFDGGVTFRPGARFGPRAVREASQYCKPYSVAHGLDVWAVLGVADAGDAPVRPYSCRETAEAVSAFASGLADAGTARCLMLGGDHSLAYANIRASWERSGRPAGGLSLVHLDAHLDTVDEVWGERWGHASPFIRAVEEGLIDPARMVSVGVRGPLNTGEDLKFAKDRGVVLVSPEGWRGSGRGAMEARLAEIERAGVPTYVTIDIDCVDPAFAPGTGTPCPGGFSSAEVLEIVRGLTGVTLAGADVVEVLPDRDPAGITALLAAHLAMEVLAVDAAGRARRDGKN